MKRYFFNFFNGERWIKDNVGQEIDGLDNIILETNASLLDVSKEFLLDKAYERIIFSVTDDLGAIIYRCTLSITKEIIDLIPLNSQDGKDYK